MRGNRRSGRNVGNVGNVRSRATGNRQRATGMSRRRFLGAAAAGLGAAALGASGVSYATSPPMEDGAVLVYPVGTSDTTTYQIPNREYFHFLEACGDSPYPNNCMCREFVFPFGCFGAEKEPPPKFIPCTQDVAEVWAAVNGNWGQNDPSEPIGPANPIQLSPAGYDYGAGGGTVLLKAHKYNDQTDYTVFNFEENSVNIRNNVIIQGEKLSSTWGNGWSETSPGNVEFTTPDPDETVISDRTVIYGGGKTEFIMGWLNYATGGLHLELQKDLTVDGLRFDNSLFSSISINSSAEVAIRDNVATNSRPSPSLSGFTDWSINFTEVYGIYLGFPHPGIAGPINIEHNLIDQIGDDEPSATGVWRDAVNFSTISSPLTATINQNTIRNCPSDGIWIHQAFGTPGSELWITNNDISQRDYGITPGPSRWPIICALTINTHITDNTLSVLEGAPGSFYSNAINFTGGTDSEIRGNTIYMEKREVEDPNFVAQAIAIDGNGGDNLNVTVEGNTITGNPDYPPDWAIAVGHWNSFLNNHTNIPVIGNDLSGITVTGAQISFGPGVNGSRVQDNLIGPLTPGFFGAGVLCAGDSNTIYNNEFGNSGIMGLKSGGFQVCVQLLAIIDFGTGALLDLPADNFVKEQGNYPVGTGGAKFQVLDAWAFFYNLDPSQIPTTGTDSLPNRVVGHDQETLADQYTENPGIGQLVKGLQPHVTPVQNRLNFGPKPEGWPEGEPWPPGQ